MKRFSLPLLAVVMALTASAFTMPKGSQAKPESLKFWTYDLYGQPGQDDPVNQNNPANYTLTPNDGQEPLDCQGSAHRCGIIAEESSGQPVMSGAQTFQRN